MSIRLFFPTRVLFILLLIITFSRCSTKSTISEADLKAQIENELKGFKGDAGLYVYHFKLGIEIGINENELFPTASMIKVPIMIKIFDKLEKKELRMDSIFYYFKDTVGYRWKGDDAVSRFKEGEDISLSKLLTHMITFSDNHASIWLQKIAGTGTEINHWLDEAGFENTRVNSRTEGRDDDYEEYGWGQTTPKEMAELLMGIRKGEIISPYASEEMYRHLTRIYWDDEALSQIPPTIQVASKSGAVSQSKSEVVLVNAPHGDYVFCIITKNQEDTRWEDDNEGYKLIRKISKLLWNTFEQDYPWTPGNGSNYKP
jgi:beta-lactamase class A